MMQKQTLPSLEEALTGTLFGEIKRDEKQIVMLDPQDLTEIEDQPFHLYSQERLEELAEDIKENGQISPCLVRKKDGKKIILAGRNRKKACELAGVQVACILIECDDPTANLIMVNSNLNQRQELLPSEKAFAYKLQKESYEAKGQRKTIAAVAEKNSGNVRKKLNVKTIQRYIKLTELTSELMNMVDSGRLLESVGFELSNLPKADMDSVSAYLQIHPGLSVSVIQAQMIRQLPNIKYDALNHLFFPNAEKEDEKGTPDKEEARAPKLLTSITIKISDLESLDCNFDFEKATKKEIKEFILDSLDSYFDRPG